MRLTVLGMQEFLNGLFVALGDVLIELIASGADPALRSRCAIRATSVSLRVAVTMACLVGGKIAPSQI